MFESVRNIFLFPWRPLISLCEKNKTNELVGSAANIITIFRIILVYPLYLLFLGVLKDRSVILGASALLLFVVIGTSDAADGEIARNTDNITTFGKLGDALADKMFFGSIFLAEGSYLLGINFLNQTEIGLGILLIACEMILMFLGIAGLFISKYRKTKLGANVFGKIKFPVECLLVFGVIIIILASAFSLLHLWILILLPVCIISAIFSIIHHIKDFNLHLPANI